MMPGSYVEYLYDVRWRLEYLDRPAKAGLWTWPGEEKNVEGKAWLQPKEGLARCIVEARCRFTKKYVVLAECAGQDFIEFRWMAAGSIPVGAGGVGGSVTFGPGIQGMTLVSRNEKVHAYLNGKVMREPNEEAAVLSHAWKF